MARKKDSTEEEWFDDEQESVEKPAKKKSKKKNKTLKIVAWIVAFAVILGILLFIRFKYTGPAPVDTVPEELTAPEDIVEEQYVTEPETKSNAASDEGSPYVEPKYLGPDVVAKETLGHIEPNIDTSVAPELFSNLRCDYDSAADVLYASLRIYNVLDTDIMIAPHGVQKGFNTYFFIRGVVDTDPGCGTELLKPKEFTDCKRIGFDLPRYSLAPGINRISVQVPGKTEALLIECPAVPEESAVNQWYNKAGGASLKPSN